MKLDYLSKHGILTGSLIILFLTVLVISAAKKIQEIKYLTETYKDFNEFEENPPPSLDVPVAVILVSLVMIVITSLMLLGILKQRLLLITPWLVLFSFGVISEIIFFAHQLSRYFSVELFLYMLCILGIQLLIFSPIAFICCSIHCKNRDQLDIAMNVHETEADCAIAENSDQIL